MIAAESEKTGPNKPAADARCSADGGVCPHPYLDRVLNVLAHPVLAAVFNLNHRAHYVHWHFFDMSVANVAVIIAMLTLFGLAIALPFPKLPKVGRR